MRKNYFLFSIFTLFSFLTYAQGPWNFNGSNDIWVSTGTAANLSSGASFSTLDVNGAGNPMLRTSSANINASAVTHAVITLKNNTANKHMRVFYQTTGTNRYVNVAITANDADFVSYYVDMTGNSDWTGTVNDLTFQFRENSSYNSALDGTIDIDNIEMTSSDIGVNMVNNSSFENWNDDTEATPVDPVGFYKHESVERSSDSHSGDYSIKVIATSTRDLAQTVNEITAGATYRVSINYKLEANTGNGVRLWSTWKDASNGNLDSGDIQTNGYFNTVSNEWATFSVDAVAPENATKMNFEVRAYNGATVYWDSFSVSKVQEPAAQPLLITTSVCSTATSVRLTGPWWGWDPAGGPAAADNGDGTWTFTFDPAPTDNMEYLLVVDGVQENLISIMANGGDCAPVTDNANYANRRWDLGTGDVTNTYGQCGSSCVAPVITLTGTDVTVNNGDTYTDEGATASDDEEGDITANIVVGGDTVDTDTDGTYTITYDVSDGAGNAAATVSRVVTVETPLVCTNLESFESFPPLDWTLTSSNTSNSITQSTSYSVTGDNSLRFSSYSFATTYDQYAVTPKLVTTTGDQTISFWYKASSTFGAEKFKVGWSSTGDDVTTDFTWSDEITATTTGVQFTKTDLPEGTTYVAIHYYSNFLYYLYVDDFCTPALFVPDCVAPNTLVASNITSSSADISWTSDATNFNVEYGAEGFTQGSGTTDTSAIASYSLTGLSSNTSYDIYVQTNCGSSGVSEWAGPYTFVTDCDAVTAFPYTEDFDTDWSCWTVVNADSDSYTWSQSSTYISPRSGLYTAHGMGSNDDYLISPKFTLTGNERVVWYDIVESSTRNNTYDVLISTTGKNIADFTTNLGTYDCTNTSWEEHIIDLSMYTGDVYIALHQTYSASTFYGFGVDDFTVEEIPACLIPSDISSSNITTSSANISWTSDATNFNVEYGAEGFTQGSGTTDTSAIASYSLTGLSSNTSYDIYVQTNCGSSGVSEWAGPYTFVTDCDAVTAFPYTEDFDTDWSCWTVVNADSDSYTWSQSSTYISPRSGLYTAHGMGSNDDYLISPKFTLTGNERVVWYDIVESSTRNNTYDVLISTTGKNIADFTTNLGTYDCTNTSWEEHIIDLSMYTGDVYIALHQTYSASTFYGFGVDDFTVEEIPSCSAPSALSVASITTNSAEISWTSDDSSFNIEVVDVTAGGTATGTATNSGVTTPYSLSGLDSNTEYEVYVQTDCGSGETSVWAGPVSFTTEPAPIVPNYTNDFATFPGEFWTEGEGALAAGPSGSTSAWLADGFGNSGFTGAARVNVYYSSFSGGNDDWLISPMFDLSSGTHYLNLNVALTAYASTASTTFADGDFVTLMVTEDNGSNWTELYRWDVNNSPSATGDEMPEIDLSSYTSMTKFAFYANSDTSNIDNDFFIDDFQITTTSLGIDEAIKSQFTYFPNPVNDVLTIKAQKAVEDITVFNMLGQVVKQQTPNTMDCTVDLSAMQSGAYFVKVSIGNNVETVRILKN